jgi:hypothetical protein
MRAHRHVIIGLSFALFAGIAQLAAQLDYLPYSPIFWIKMTTLVALLANGRIIQLTGRRVAAAMGAADAIANAETTTEALRREQDAAVTPHYRALRAAAIRSVVLWAAMIVLGLLLTTVPPNV